MSDRRTDLPTHRAPNFEQRVREVLQTYLGRQGDPLDRGLTLRDLLQAGVVKVREGFTLRTGMAEVPISAGDAVAPAYEPDLSAPPMPSGFEVAAAITHVFVKHDAPAYQQGHGPLRTRLYGLTLQAGDPLPTFDDAVEIAQFSGAVYAHPTNPSTTWRLWIRWESVDGGLSLPAGGTNGLQATTGEDVGLLLDALAGKIGEPALLASLNSRINLIDAPTTGLTTKVAGLTSQVASIQSTLADFEAMPEYDPAATYAAGDLVKYSGGLYRATAATTGNLPTDTAYWEKVGDYASLGDAVAAHAFQLADHETRISSTETGLAAEVTARQTLAATVGSNTAAIQTEATTRAGADSALSTQISTLNSTLTGSIGAVSAGLEQEQLTRANADTALAGSITTLTSAVNDNAAAIQTEATTRANADGALASQITTLQSTVNGNTAAIQTEATTRATETGQLLVQYTVKADLNGYVTGYGLASTSVNGAPLSEFAIVADKFSIAPVATNPASADGSPFYHLTAPTTVDGVTVPAGTYMKSAFIADASITNAKIRNAAIDDAKIATLSAGKLTAGTLAVGQWVASQGYLAGSSGWRINADGSAEFSTATVRGTIYASLGAIGGIAIGSTYIQSNYAAGVSGFRLNSDGSAEFNSITARGRIEASSGTFAGSLVAATGTFSGSLNAAEGTFAGSLAAATGTFSGTMTASAVNAVNTVNIAGQAVTFPNYSRRSDSRFDGSYSPPVYDPGTDSGW